MTSRNLFARRFPLLSCSCLLMAFAQISFGQEPSADELAIRKAVQSYTDAFNRHDAQAVAAHWTSTGEFVLPSGKTLRSREQIAEEFTAYFAEAKDVHVDVPEPAIEFLSPNVAVETGSAVVIEPQQDPLRTEYVAIHTRTPEGWKMDSVRETEVAETTVQNEKLDELDWMVGSWIDESEDVLIETTCKWTKNRSFLTRSFKVVVEGRVDAAGTQVVGWDPRNETIRSWSFTSDGGFGVGAWSREGDRWSIRTLTVLPDGRQGSFTAIFDKLDNNTFEFSTVGREIDGQLMPNVDPVRVVRK